MFIIMVLTGWRYGAANVGLWQIGGGGETSVLIVSVVCRGSEGPRRQALRPVALLCLLLICFLTEEKTRQLRY